MEYQIIECFDTEELSKVINDLIDQGWEPLGGVSVSCWHDEGNDCYRNSNTYYTCVQAMIKK